jgi:hypothetical protein
MPRTRWHLPKEEEFRYRELALRLKAAGCDVDIPDVEQPCVQIVPDETPLANYVADWPSGGVAFVLWVAISSLVPRLIIRGYDLLCSAWDSPATFLTDPTIMWPYDDLYRLHDGSTLRRTEVLNHRIDGEGKLGRGAMIEGWFLARGPEPIADSYRHGSSIEVTLSVTHQFGEDHSAPIPLYVHRSARRQREEPLSPGRRAVLAPGQERPLRPSGSLYA